MEHSSPPAEPLRAGDPQVLGPFRLLGRLGAGGMGVVFHGIDAAGRHAAVKLPRAEYAEDPVFRARFAREVAAAARVGGRFTAGVLAAATSTADRPWLATELVVGPSLADLVHRDGPLNHDGQRALAAGLAEALVAIHAAGVVHRDLKPSNVLCAADGPRVIDFGIAVGGDASRLTQVGMLVGSPAWMSPEHLRGAQVGPAADVFGWGLLVAYAATGRMAFGSGEGRGLLGPDHEQPADLGPPGALAPILAPLVASALTADPAARPTASALCASLAGVPAGDPAAAAAGAEELVDRTWLTPLPRHEGAVQRPSPGPAGYPASGRSPSAGVWNPSRPGGQRPSPGRPPGGPPGRPTGPPPPAYRSGGPPPSRPPKRRRSWRVLLILAAITVAVLVQLTGVPGLVGGG